MRQAQITESLGDVLFCGSVLVPLAYACDLGPVELGAVHGCSAVALLVNLFYRHDAGARSVASTALHVLTLLGDALFFCLALCSVVDCCHGTQVGFLPIRNVCGSGRPEWLRVSFLVAIGFALCTDVSRVLCEWSLVREVGWFVVYAFLKAMLIVWSSTTILAHPVATSFFLAAHGLGLLLAVLTESLQHALKTRTAITPLHLVWESATLVLVYNVFRGSLSRVGNAHLDTFSPFQVLILQAASWWIVFFRLPPASADKLSPFSFTPGSRAVFAVSKAAYVCIVGGCFAWQAVFGPELLARSLRYNATVYAILGAGLVFYLRPPSLAACVGAASLLGAATVIAWSEALHLYEDYRFFLPKYNAVLLGCAGVFPVCYGILTVPHYMRG